jgi:hypothetical protein
MTIMTGASTPARSIGAATGRRADGRSIRDTGRERSSDAASRMGAGIRRRLGDWHTVPSCELDAGMQLAKRQPAPSSGRRTKLTRDGTDHDPAWVTLDLEAPLVPGRDALGPLDRDARNRQGRGSGPLEHSSPAVDDARTAT